MKQWSERAKYPDLKDGCALDLEAEQGTTTAETSASVSSLGGVVYYKGTSTHGYNDGDVYCTGEDPLSESNGSLMVLAPNDGSASGSPVRLLVDDPGASITVHDGQSGGVYLEPGHSLCIGVANLARLSSNVVVISASSGAATASRGTSSSCASTSSLNPSVASLAATAGSRRTAAGSSLSTSAPRRQPALHQSVVTRFGVGAAISAPTTTRRYLAAPRTDAASVGCRQEGAFDTF